MSTASTQGQLERVIIDAIENFGPAEEVTREASFRALDIDSLDLVELAQIIEDEFAVELDSADVARLTTVGEVIDLVAARAS